MMPHRIVDGFKAVDIKKTDAEAGPSAIGHRLLLTEHGYHLPAVHQSRQFVGDRHVLHLLYGFRQIGITLTQFPAQSTEFITNERKGENDQHEYGATRNLLLRLDGFRGTKATNPMAAQ